MNKKIFVTTLLTLVAVFAITLSAHADIIRGRVVDSKTKEPLAEASVKMTQRFGDYGQSLMFS